jgi:hypothetical protein
VAESEKIMTYNDDIYEYNQARLESFRQEAQLRALLKNQPSPLRQHIAKTLRQLAIRLYPEVETQQTLHHRY